MKKLLALILAVLMVTSGAMAAVNPEGMPIVTEPLTLTVAVSQSPIQGDFNEMVILKDFEAVSGIDMEFQNIPSSDRSTPTPLTRALAAWGWHRPRTAPMSCTTFVGRAKASSCSSLGTSRPPRASVAARRHPTTGTS